MKKAALSLALIFSGLQTGAALAWDPQLDNASVQVQGILRQQINEEDIRSKNLWTRKKKLKPEQVITIRDAMPNEDMVAGNRFQLSEDGTLLVRGGELEDGMSEIANTGNDGEMLPVILLLQADEKPKKEENVIRINAQTIKNINRKK